MEITRRQRVINDLLDIRNMIYEAQQAQLNGPSLFPVIEAKRILDLANLNEKITEIEKVIEHDIDPKSFDPLPKEAQQ